MIRIAIALAIFLGLMEPAPAACFAFFCGPKHHRHHVRHHVRHHRPVIVVRKVVRRVVVKHPIIVKRPVIVRRIIVRKPDASQPQPQPKPAQKPTIFW